MKTTLFISAFFLLLFFFFSAKGISQPVGLSGNFTDPSMEPLVIHEKIFPKAVIYEYGKMYAPAEDFLSMMGVFGNLCGLPDELIIKSKIAPTSLLGIGPDRYTGESIYYLDVTGTLIFLEINYIQEGWKITVPSAPAIPTAVPASTPAPSPQPTPTEEPVEKGSVTICWDIDNIDTLRGGFIKLLGLDSKNNIMRYQYLSKGSHNFRFSDLLPGEYRIEAEYYYNEKGPLVKNPDSEGYYFDYTSYYVNLSLFITLKNGENFSYQVTEQDLRRNSYTSGKKYINNPSVYDSY